MRVCRRRSRKGSRQAPAPEAAPGRKGCTEGCGTPSARPLRASVPARCLRKPGFVLSLIGEGPGRLRPVDQ